MLPPIRIMHVFLHLDLGGAERAFLTTAKHLPREQFQFTVCCLGQPGSLVPEARSAGHDVIALGRLQTKNDLRAVTQLAQLMRRREVHIVQSYLYSRASVYARIAARLARVPLVLAMEQGRVAFPSHKKIWADRFLKWVTDHFVAVSQAEKADLVKRQRLPAHKVSVVYNGVDPKPYDGCEHRAPSGRSPLIAPVLAMIARLDPVKGHIYLLDAMPAVLARFPDARLMIVGSGPAEHALRSRVRQLGLTDRVAFTGVRDDVPQLLQGVDIVVLPSLHEGFGLVLVEAMLSALPVVATKVGGIPEIVTEAVTGLLVPPGDARALAQAITKLLADPDWCKQMGAAGRERALAHFTAEESATATRALYARLLADKGLIEHRDSLLLPG